MRVDGRSLLDLRHADICVNNIASAHGSSRVSRKFSDTSGEVTCGVKLEVSSVSAATHSAQVPRSEGSVELSINLSAVEVKEASSAAQSSWKEVGRQKKYLENIFLSVLNSMFHTSRRNTEGEGEEETNPLSIIKGRYAWVVFIDVIVNRTDGNLIDLISLAVFSALRVTRKPKINLFKSGTFEENLKSEGSPMEVETSAIEFDEFEIDPDPLLAEVFIPESFLTNLFLSVSLFELGDGIYVADASEKEELYSSTSLVIFLNADEKVCGMYMPQRRGGIRVKQLQKLIMVCSLFEVRH